MEMEEVAVQLRQRLTDYEATAVVWNQKVLKSLIFWKPDYYVLYMKRDLNLFVWIITFCNNRSPSYELNLRKFSVLWTQF